MSADRPNAPGKKDAAVPRQVGDIVGDRYRLVRVIARGGTGVVYEAEHTYTERRVALKMLRPRVAGGEAQMARFVREAKSAAKLSHPHIVEVVDMGRDAADGALFLVHTLLVGEDLEQRLERVGRLDPGVLVDVLLPILDGLAFAHRSGVLHRDLKPSNIFLVAGPGGTFVPKLIDFGASKSLDEGDDWTKLTQIGAFVGTPVYMSPEAIRGDLLDARADVWSVGIIMHRALAGALPFDAGNLHALFHRIQSSRAPRIADPAVPAHLADVVQRALAPAREDRYPDVAALIDALTARPTRRPVADEPEDETLIVDTMASHRRPVDLPAGGAEGEAWDLQKGSRRVWPSVVHPISDELTNVPAENARVERSMPPVRVVAEPTPTPHAMRRPLVLAAPARRAHRPSWEKPVRMGLTGSARDTPDELLRSVEKAIGRRWSLVRFASYSSLVDALCEDEIELAWLPPVAYLRARRLAPVHLLLALARGGTASYGSAIIAAERAGIRALSDVRGKRVVWVDVWSAAGYLMPCGVLRAAGLDPTQVFASQSFVGSHAAVLEALESGRADLGATYCTLDDDGAMVAAPWSELRGIVPVALSGAIPGDAICAAGELSLKDAEAVVEPLLALAAEAEGAALLERLFGTSRFAEVDASTYHALEGA